MRFVLSGLPNTIQDLTAHSEMHMAMSEQLASLAANLQENEPKKRNSQ